MAWSLCLLTRPNQQFPGIVGTENRVLVKGVGYCRNANPSKALLQSGELHAQTGPVVLDQRTLVPRVESTESSPTLASEHVSTTTTGAWFHLNNTMASLARCTVSVAPMIKAQFADRAMSESTLTVAFAAQQGPTWCYKACYVLQPMASSPAGPVP